MNWLTEFLAALAALPEMQKAIKQNTEAIKVTQEELTTINAAVDDLKTTIDRTFGEFETELTELKAKVEAGTATPEDVQALVGKIAALKETVRKFDVDPTKGQGTEQQGEQS